jgi:hypothetical protein
MNAKTKDLIKEAVIFYGEYLMGKRLANNIDVEIKITRGLANRDGVHAWCTWDDDNVRPRAFEIELDHSACLKDKNLCELIAHEMVHVKQYARGDIKTYRFGRQTWKGKTVLESIPYRKKPWEVEAFSLEKSLAKKFQEHKNNG